MSKNEDDKVQIVRSSGNIFEHLGLELSAEDEFKIEVAREISRIVVARNYTQKQVAQIFGTDQAKVSHIVRGRLANISAERLLRFLLALGVNMDVHLSEESSQSSGKVKFHSQLDAACG